MNAEQHEAALKRANELMDAEAGTPEAEELSQLADAIMAYEEAHFPIGDPRWTCTCFEVFGEDPNCVLHHLES